MNHKLKLAYACMWALLLSFLFTPSANAQTDITGVIDSLTTYKTAAIVVGVAILLFVLGRRVVSKLAK